MPIVQVALLEGRAPEVKEALIDELTAAVERALDVPRTSVRVLLTEVPPAHWGVGGVSKQRQGDAL